MPPSAESWGETVVEPAVARSSNERPSLSDSPPVSVQPLDLDRPLEVMREIGRGGMGSIRKARDPLIGREVAMKTLHAELGMDPEVVNRFIEEAQVTGQLEHPNVVPVYALSRDPRLTDDGEKMLGTPAYMAPEQARGRDVGVRADVYGIGGLLYVLLTARHPHQGENLNALLYDLLTDEVQPPAERVPDWVLPPELCRITQRALALRQAERYASVAELREELVAFQRGGDGWPHDISSPERWCIGRATTPMRPSSSPRVDVKRFTTSKESGKCCDALAQATFSERWHCCLAEPAPFASRRPRT